MHYSRWTLPLEIILTCLKILKTQTNNKLGNKEIPLETSGTKKALNIDSLFSVSVNEDHRIGIWNAQPIRDNTNIILNASLTMTCRMYCWSWNDLHPGYNKDELPSRREFLPCKESYKFYQLPRSHWNSSSRWGMLCLYKKNIEI